MAGETMSREQNGAVRERASIWERLKGKAAFLSSYMRMAEGTWGRWRMLQLAWRRFDVYRPSLQGRVKNKMWSAKLRSIGGYSATMCVTNVQHLAVFDEIFRSDVYDLGVIDFIPDLIIDCGAHVGFFSLLASNRWPEAKVIAFEPQAENASYTRRNAASNGLDWTVLEAAVSSRSGWLKFNPDGFMGSLSPEGSMMVPVVDLPQLLKSLPWQRILLKMDIEGEELDLLPKVLPVLPPTSAVFVEAHGSPEKCASFLEDCLGLGYSSHHLRRRESEDGKWHFIDLVLLPTGRQVGERLPGSGH